MDVSIIGKALTPVPIQCLPSSQNEYETSQKVRQLYLPLSRHYSNTKQPMQLFMESRLGEKGTWNQSDSTGSRLNLTPDFRSMTLAETYNFARAQLKSCPMMHHLQQRRNLTTPTFSFTKAKLSHKALGAKVPKNEIETCKSVEAPPVLGTTSRESPTNQTNVNKEIYFQQHLDRRHSKSACGLHKVRRKSGRKKKLSNNESLGSRRTLLDDSQNITRLSTDFPIKHQPLPPKTQSVIVLKNITVKPKKDEQAFSPNFKSKRDRNSRNESEVLKLPSARSLTRKCSEPRPSIDGTLQSLDSSLRLKGRHERQLSMRIQLIHKFGNEDVIGKHIEMKRKREAADRHEKKNLKHQANASLKEIQRSKIYALNALMTRLEQEQFEDYKQNFDNYS